MIQAHKAERRKAKLRLAVTGPSGSGKTFSSILIARGIAGQTGKILLIDTERGSGELYANLTDYDVAPMSPPYRTEDYIEAIKYAEDNGYDVCVLDSITHAWAGQGGLLEQVDQISDRTGNKFSSWGKVTPKHQAFVDAMLQSKIHIIATMRSKTEYVLVQDANGKNKPEKRGLAPIQRDGMDYEFTTVFDIAPNHTAEASKDRTGLFDGTIFLPRIETGETLRQWLETGAVQPQPPQIQTPAKKKEKPANCANMSWVNSMRKLYEKNGWSMKIFDDTQYDEGNWDKDAITADWKKRDTAAKPAPAAIEKMENPAAIDTAAKPEPKPDPVKTPENPHCACGNPVMTDDEYAQLLNYASIVGIKVAPPTNICKDCARKWKQDNIHNTVDDRLTCADCGKIVLPKEAEQSKQKYGVALCPTCYKARLEAAVKASAPAEQVCSKCGKKLNTSDISANALFRHADNPLCNNCLIKSKGA